MSERKQIRPLPFNKDRTRSQLDYHYSNVVRSDLSDAKTLVSVIDSGKLKVSVPHQKSYRSNSSC